MVGFSLMVRETDNQLDESYGEENGQEDLAPRPQPAHNASIPLGTGRDRMSLLEDPAQPWALGPPVLTLSCQHN